MAENSEWRYVKSLTDPGLIEAYEKHIRYRFPDEFKAFAAANNGGRPPKKKDLFYSFCAGRKCVRVFKALFSFNRDDPGSIWKIEGWQREWGRKEGELDRYIAFANDPGGNMICFDKNDSKIVYINLEYCDEGESEMRETVADSFTELIGGLFSEE